MSGLKLYSFPNNSRSWKAQIAAAYNGIELEVVNPDFEKELKSEAFKAKNPLQKLPVLETPCGCIFESNAIARYVARLNNSTNLLGGKAFEQAKVDQWMDFCNNEIDPARAIWLYPIFGYLQYNAKANAEAKKDMTTALTVLNDHLLNRTFLVGNSITLADITIVTSLVELYRQVFAPKFIAPFGNVTRWFTTCVNQPEFAKLIGKVDFAKEEAQPPKADKKAEAKKEEPKKEEAKKEAPKPAADDEEEEKPKLKAVNPLDALPESPMILDVIKKLAFSVRPFLPDFFEKLWPQFDANGYSFYTCDYNYNNENTVFFMTGNAVGGFIQRSDATRKYAMGVMNITGKDEETAPFTISGAWLFRGPEITREMKEENPDSEYYTWKKVDVSTEEGRNKIKEQFQAETINGLPVLDRRYFK